MVATTLATVLLAGACGKDRPDLVFGDTIPPRSATTMPEGPPPTEPTGPQLGPWQDVTGNLAGMASECGNMSYLAGRPESDQLIAGVAGQGLWANTSGAEWTKLGGGGPVQVQNRPQTILFDPDNSSQYWVSGSYSPPGAFRTTNGGGSFDPLGDVIHLDGLGVDLSDPGRRTLLAGGHERADLFRSTDGGATWSNVGPNLPSGIGFPAWPYVVDAQTHLLGSTSFDPGGTGIFRTTDAGQTWSRIDDVDTGVKGPPLRASDGKIYWSLLDGGLASSTDDGATWQVTRRVLNSFNLVELADGSIAGIGSTDRVVATSDQGRTWDALGPALPFDDGYGLAFSRAQNAVFVWRWDCGDVVPPGSIQRLDLTPAAPPAP